MQYQLQTDALTSHVATLTHQLTASNPRMDSRSRRIDDWVSGTVSGSSHSKGQRKGGSTKRGPDAPSVAITADDTNLGDELSMDGNQTERSHGDAGDMSGRGGFSTVWRMARWCSTQDLLHN